MTNATIFLFPGPRVQPVPIPDAPGVGQAERRRRSRAELAVRWSLAFLIGIAAGAILPMVALILSGHAFLAALGI